MESRSVVKDYKKEIPGGFGKYVDPLDKTRKYKHVYLFPTLYKKTSRGNIMEWHMIVRVGHPTKELDISEYYTTNPPKKTVAYFWTWTIENTESGGTPQVSDETAIKEGKNIGKSNETNVFTQALSEAFSLYRKKMKEGYKTDIEAKGDTPWRKPPMRFYLADNYPKKITFPAYLLPKFDGILGEVVFNPKTRAPEIISRQLHPFINVPKHLKELEPIYKKYPKLVLFGEFYEHGLKLQEISGITRDTNSTNKLTLWIFDGLMSDKLNMKYKDRRTMLTKLFEEFPNLKYIKMIPSSPVKDRKALDKLYKKYIEEGFEGGMYYNPDGIYKFFYTASRSNTVLKMKPRKSAEFKIVGFKTGRGKNAGLVTFILETEDGYKFSAEPNMEESVRRKLFQEFQNNFYYDGKMATITYSDLSEKGIPQQPKFIAIREEDEF